MVYGLDEQELAKYVDVVIPNIERELSRNNLPADEQLELYNLYVEVLKLTAFDDFRSFNKFLEIDEDHSIPTKAFYHHRKDHLGEMFDTLNDMEVYDKYDIVLISIAPRIGKTTTGIRFLSWIIGRHPENTQLATSYSDNITSSFYVGVMEIISNPRYNQVFPKAPLINQNAKKQEIWLQVAKRYPSITFVSIGASMTGRAEAGNYLYCDDLVSGYEEAVSLPRLEKLWQLYTVNAKQRKKKGAKEIHIATRWSVHDVITKLSIEHADNPRCKIIKVDCYDENGESTMDFVGGFDTAYYKDMEKTMDKFSFGALYRQNPVEREGLLYDETDLQYYFTLPETPPDSIIAICDSKNMGKDNVASLVGYVYGDLVYIDDVIYDDRLPEVTRPRVADLWFRHKVVRGDVEMNNGGNYYAEDLNEIIRSKGGKTSIRTFFSSNNKTTKIITYSDYVKKYFVFKDKSLYTPRSDYGMFMADLFSWTQVAKNKHDDAPDATAMLAQLVQDISYNTIKTVDRRKLGL